MLTLKLLFYANQYTSSADAEPEEMTWETFRDEILREPQIVHSKGSEAQLFPGEMLDGAKSKGDSSVKQINLGCFDLDEVPDDKLEEVYEMLRNRGLEAVVTSTFSHLEQKKKDGTNRVRVFMPLSRPVLAGEWRIFWSNVRLLLLGLIDETTSHPSKHFLLPSMPPGEDAAGARIYKEFHGKPIDVDATMTMFGISVLAESELESFDLGKETITAQMFQGLLSKKAKGDEGKLHQALKLALSKESYAVRGTRENTLFELAGLLAREFPRGNPDHLCIPLKFSIDYEEQKGGPKYTEFRDKVIRRQRDYLRRMAEKRLEIAREEARVAFAKNSVTDYSPESLQAYLSKTGGLVTFKDMETQLVLVYQQGFYVFNGEGYEYSVTNALLATIRENLRYRAEKHLGFDYYFPSEGDKPPQEKNADAFVRDHGRKITQVRYNFSGVSYLDPKTRILWLSEVESPERIVPKYWKEVDDWMQAFCGNEKLHLQLQQWLSQYPDTSQALAGLVLAGPTGIGKSAFAKSMAKAFGINDTCSMDNYFSDFNSQVVGNPLIWADENLPEVHGKIPTDKLRSLISRDTHEINRKGQPIIPLKGFARVIMSIQNLGKFDFGRGHTREDIDAIEKRFLFILGRAEAAALFNYELFVDNKAIAQHMMYLAQTMRRASERFGVDTAGSGYAIMGDPVAMGVLDVLFDYLVEEAKEAGVEKALTRVWPAFVNKGKIFVNVRAFTEEWESQWSASRKKVPRQAEVKEALKTLSVTGKATPVNATFSNSPKGILYWEISGSLFVNRALAIDNATEPVLLKLLEISHEIQFRTRSLTLTPADREKRVFAMKSFQGLFRGAGD